MKTLNKLTLALLATCAFNASAKVESTIEKTFELTAQGQLVLENVNGDVNIESWQQNSIKVTAELQAKTQEDLDRIEVNMKQSGNRVSVETDYSEGRSGWSNNGSSGSVDYTVMVPANIDLRDIELVNGSLNIENVSGELNADVVNGSVEATGLAADVEVDSVNGAVELSFADSAKNLDISVDTVNGGIRLYLPDDFGAQVEVSTGNGSIKTDYGLSGTKGAYYGTDLKGSFGDGSSEIELESVNGSVKILRK
ncbi:DUF4097 family beta strand repeat-containing protein [Thalassomonas sp. M1454]|uniref:DUF4097 family beta strand repeat-containing protein n=1 Tax=Thalassomonas sp. M1454 TaxID=2594477 RepID=UPI0011807975|nr:DUF4097 family beta strand repeat-containing protein [Thalassomonas sp. M1454]TRX55857.1 DUF4097 domain-containing protein [Thalassomonas sp. M1454]